MGYRSGNLFFSYACCALFMDSILMVGVRVCCLCRVLVLVRVRAEFDASVSVCEGVSMIMGMREGSARAVRACVVRGMRAWHPSAQWRYPA